MKNILKDYFIPCNRLCTSKRKNLSSYPSQSKLLPESFNQNLIIYQVLPGLTLLMCVYRIFLTTTHFRGSFSSAGPGDCSSHTTITSLQPRRQLLGQSSQGHILFEEIICRMKKTQFKMVISVVWRLSLSENQE